MGSLLCEQCTGVCCRYIALPIEEPTERRDYDDIRWYVMHEGISVFVEDGDWYIQIAARCKNLQPDNRCGIYEERPAICREYEAGDCDYAGGDYHYEMQFFTSEQIEEYAVSQLGRKGVFSKQPRAPRRPGKASLHALTVLSTAP
jgi:Fe-S-cluster containining protein